MFDGACPSCLMASCQDCGALGTFNEALNMVHWHPVVPVAQVRSALENARALRASAEERIAALREALTEIASHPVSLTCDEAPYYTKAVARAALTADDAAKEAGK